MNDKTEQALLEMGLAPVSARCQAHKAISVTYGRASIWSGPE